MELLRAQGELTRADAKTYRHHRFRVPDGVTGLRLAFAYDRGGELPHSLVTLQLFDPSGFRGAAHRFAPRQAIEIDASRATPGFLPGPMAAGEWTAELDIHCVIPRADGRPNGYELTVETLDAGGATAVDAPPSLHAPVARPQAARPTPQAPAALPLWLRGELHLHSQHSDGRWTTGEMAERARGRGLDFIFLTDHNTTTGVEILSSQLGGRIPVYPGIELTTYHGHALALGADRWLDWRTGHEGRTADDLARSVREADALFVVAHPDAPPDDVCTGCRWTYADFDPSLAHAVEVWGGLWDGAEERNQGCLDLWRKWLNRGSRLAATGATDAHRPEDWEGPVPLTYVYARDPSLSSVLEALRAGRTFVSSGPGIEIRAVGYDGPTARVGETASRAGTHGIRVDCIAAPPAELRIVANGEIVATSRIDGQGHLEARPRERDTWCCGELWSERGDVLLAVTGALYLA